MMNYCVIIGRICGDLKLSKDKTLEVVLVVPRSYKNKDRNYDTDHIECKLYGSLATNTVEYCKAGDLVAIKGSLEKDNNMMYVSAEKISFLASKSGKDDN